MILADSIKGARKRLHKLAKEGNDYRLQINVEKSPIVIIIMKEKP